MGGLTAGAMRPAAFFHPPKSSRAGCYRTLRTATAAIAQPLPCWTSGGESQHNGSTKSLETPVILHGQEGSRPELASCLSSNLPTGRATHEVGLVQTFSDLLH